MDTSIEKSTDLNDKHVETVSPETAITTPDEPIKLSDKPWFEVTKDVVVPLLAVLVGGWFTWSQFQISNARQDADSADKARETREQVLTDYSKIIQELFVTRNLLGTNGEGEFVINRDQTNIARGHTLIALRRLNIAASEEKNGLDWLPEFWENQLNWLTNPLKRVDCWSVDGKDEADCIKLDRTEIDDEESKNDSGRLKGLLIRYLYDAQLIGYGSFSNKPAMMSLSGADINDVVLEDAWLPRIDLHNAWLENSNFRNASLWSANLKDARLTGSNLSGADLRFVDLKNIQSLDRVTLNGACYLKGEEAQYLPPNFNPEERGMIAIAKEQSDPKEANFERCPRVP